MPSVAASIVARRLAAQQLARPALSTPAEVVAWFGAMQAQDPGAARWAVGLRVAGAGATDGGIEDALADGSLVRTHALRGTWHLVAPADARWILGLVGPHVLARSARRHRELGLDAPTFRRSAAVLARALEERSATRPELGAALSRAGVSTEGQRLSYLLQRAELEGLVCGAGQGSGGPAYLLLERLAPARARRLERDEALAELARRYFQSRGPASAQDFAWWSGLPAADVRRALQAAAPALVSAASSGRTLWSCRAACPAGRPGRAALLLPAFDEYLVGYRDRAAVLDPEHARRVNAGGGLLDPCAVIGGRVVGTWRRRLARDSVAIELAPFVRLAPSVERALSSAARRYGAFLGREAEVSVVARRRS